MSSVSRCLGVSFSVRTLRLWLVLLPTHLRSVGIGGGARAQDPADDDSEQEHGRDIEEVRRGRHQARLVRFRSASSRSTSRCTTARRLARENRYTKSTTTTNT